MQAPPPSAWVCPLEPGALWASCSWEGSSPAAAAEMAGEGHRWSRFQRGSVSPDVPRTQSKEKKWNVNLWCRSNLESREATGEKKGFDQNKTTLQVNKAMLTSADQRNGAIWASKTSPSPATKNSPGRKGCWEDESMLAFSDESVTTRYLWHSKEILKKKLKAKVADWRSEQTLKISDILRCCGREQWFSMDRMTGMLELTNADRLIASTTSWGSEERFNLLWEQCRTN